MESFVYILENEYQIDIIKILLLKNIEKIIDDDILKFLMNFSENIYYIIEPISIKLFEKINDIYEKELNIEDPKEIFLKYQIIQQKQFHHFSSYSFKNCL